MNSTSVQYDAAIAVCRDIFSRKLHDYGTAWRAFRSSSLTDQIYIKAKRIRGIQERGSSKVDEGIVPEFMGIINYSVMALVQLELGYTDDHSLKAEQAMKYYDDYIAKAKALMEDKNHDYGEAWREMRISSLTDMIIVKLQRIKQIEDNQGKTIISEGIDANFYDIINYAVFALIRLAEEDKHE